MLGAIVSAVLASTAHAGVFSVVPVRIYMTPRDRAVAITVTNEGDSPMVLQAEVSTWRQKPDGTDEQLPSEDLILSPPILKLAPKGHQVVRLARLAPADASQQLTYRLLIREVPEATPPKDQTLQIPIALALSLPVFITPPAAAREITCQPSTGAEFQVSCANTGKAYAQVRAMELRQSNQIVGKMEGGVYILPGARKTISLQRQQALAAGSAQIEVGFDDGKTQVFNVTVP
ncbi:fimbria/pilus periplasmic chaperone [Ramlibacter sp. XY19]|uniref:fimbrial biogenesis chaperone n=1 Tax=Ramlibacter paludis TaxID=2908000 RepID=UPI0023DB4ABD|nr:fimbria/pilus periplasmic chaperone [Ramlibacter paludis]